MLAHFKFFFPFMLIIFGFACSKSNEANPNINEKTCYLKSSKYNAFENIKITYNTKNQVEKLVKESIYGPINALFSYNSDGSVADIVNDDKIYKFIYEKGILKKIIKNEGAQIRGERILTYIASKVSTIQYFQINGTQRTLTYTHTFNYSNNNLVSYNLAFSNIDIDILSNVKYDNKPNVMSKSKTATDAVMYALTDDFLLFPIEEILLFSSANNSISGDFRSNIVYYLISKNDPSTINTNELNLKSPKVPFSNSLTFNEQNLPLKTIFKYRDLNKGDVNVICDFEYDCK